MVHCQSLTAHRVSAARGGGGPKQSLHLESKYQKNPLAHKNKIGTSPPPKKKPKIPPPPLKRGILWTWLFLQNGRIFPSVHQIGAAISGPRIADKNFTDTRIFLKVLSSQTCSQSSVNRSVPKKVFLEKWFLSWSVMTVRSRFATLCNALQHFATLSGRCSVRHKLVIPPVRLILHPFSNFLN